MTKETKITLGICLASIALFIGFIYYYKATNPTIVQVVDSQVLVREDSQKIISKTDDKLTLVEFADFECEACKAAHPLVKKILKDYDGRITYVFRNFPLHGNSVLAAKTAEAAGEQGKFWEMYDKLFENQLEWGEKSTPQTGLFSTYALELGLDMEKFKTSLNSNDYADKIQRDQKDGVTAGVKGTPTFFLNGKKVNPNELINEIEKILKQ